MKKGFTLVELIAVIVILAIVAITVFPNINEIITSSRRDIHENQIIDIEKSASKWATDHFDILDQYHVNLMYISLSDIQEMDYLERGNIMDPLTKEEMNGCIQIKYQEEKYIYHYEEKTCENYASSEYDETLGYIIYTYDSKSKKLEESSNSKKLVATGETIYNYYKEHNMIYANGEENNGLYELENEYVFRGSEVNNYVTFASKTWRILGINKKDFSIRLIGVTGIPNSFDQDNKIEFQNASSNVEILSKEEFDKKVKTSDFYVDTIDGSEFSRTALYSVMGKTKIPLKMGLISILDYVNASTSEECDNNYLSSSCKNGNYLYNMISSNGSTWTVNSNGTQVWYIDTDGNLKLENATSIKYLYPVISIDSSTYITNLDVAVGSSSSPYKLK